MSNVLLNVVGQSNLQDVSVNNITHCSGIIVQNNNIQTEEQNRDTFLYYQSSGLGIFINNNIPFTNNIIGPTPNNNGFIASKTGYYLVTLSCKGHSVRPRGIIRTPYQTCGIGIKVNNTIYGNLIIAANDTDYEVFNGMRGSMIVKANKTQRINVYVAYAKSWTPLRTNKDIRNDLFAVEFIFSGFFIGIY